MRAAGIYSANHLSIHAWSDDALWESPCYRSLASWMDHFSSGTEPVRRLALDESTV